MEVKEPKRKFRSQSRNRTSRRRSYIKRSAKNSDQSTPEAYDVPMNLKTTKQDIQNRKHLDLRRWFCISRPQLAKSCGVSSLVSCWNYLHSRLGAGNKEPISQEFALVTLGINPPFDNIEFGSFTGNHTLIQWYKKLNQHLGVKGSASIYYKGCGKAKTNINANEALDGLIKGLRSENQAFIYHCYNHYFCPIGFDLTPNATKDAYQAQSQYTPWIAIGETSKKHPSIHFKKWEDINLDITTPFPKYFDIRRDYQGMLEKTDEKYIRGPKAGTNLHCIIKFTKF